MEILFTKKHTQSKGSYFTKVYVNPHLVQHQMDMKLLSDFKSMIKYSLVLENFISTKEVKTIEPRVKLWAI